MTQESLWRIPASTLYWLQHTPLDRPVTMLLRHSVRGALPPDGIGYHVPLLPAGVQLAIELGQLLGTRLQTLHSSPLARCMQTAAALRKGSGVALNINPDQHLGDPGVFVVDAQQAAQCWQAYGHEYMMQWLINRTDLMPGMANPAVAAHALVRHMLDIAGDEPGIHVFVTHDSLVAATALRWLKQKITHYQAPAYLEAAFFWRTEDTIQSAFATLPGAATRLSAVIPSLALKA